MALVTRSSRCSPDMTSLLNAPQIADLVAGENLDIGAPCHINTSDGLVYMSNATAADADAELDGFTARAVDSGEPVTLYGLGARFHYADSGLTPGATYYMGATDGRIDTAATTGDAVGCMRAISATDLRVIRDS